MERGCKRSGAVGKNQTKMELKTYQAKGKLVYNKVVAQGQSDRGEWQRSEVVVECHTDSGNTFCKVFTYWGALNIPVDASITLSWRMEVGKPYTDKNGKERNSFTPRIVEIEEEHENKEILF